MEREIEQEVSLSPVFDIPRWDMELGSKRQWRICIASVYPSLKPGTYRFVKRMLKTDNPDILESWSVLPVEEFSYVSAEFKLYKKLTWNSSKIQPMYISDYDPYEPVNKEIEMSAGNVTPEGCELTVKNNSKSPFLVSYYFNLWYYEEGQWLPLAPLSYFIDALMAWTIPPGETAVESRTWDKQYGSLKPGLYRLVATTYSEGRKYAVFEFEVTKESK